jgi:hypothetical protein
MSGNGHPIYDAAPCCDRWRLTAHWTTDLLARLALVDVAQDEAQLRVLRLPISFPVPSSPRLHFLGDQIQLRCLSESCPTPEVQTSHLVNSSKVHKWKFPLVHNYLQSCSRHPLGQMSRSSVSAGGT